MVDATQHPDLAVPIAEVPDVELYHRRAGGRSMSSLRYAKTIAIQYSSTAIAIGMVALVLSWLMRLQLGFPGTFTFITPEAYYQFITMHGMIMVIYLLIRALPRRLRQRPDPADGRRAGHGVPLRHMLSYWIYLGGGGRARRQLLRPRRPDRRRLELLYPPQAILSGTPGGQQAGILLMLFSLILFIIGFTMGGLNYVVTVLQGAPAA